MADALTPAAAVRFLCAFGIGIIVRMNQSLTKHGSHRYTCTRRVVLPGKACQGFRFSIAHTI